MASPLLILALTSLVLLSIYRFIIHPYLLSPLSKVPAAHWSAPMTPLWILSHRHRSTDTFAVHAAHTRLGPLIRLGPSELSVNCIDGGVRTVYGGGWDKPAWYGVFAGYGGVPNTFSTLARGPHGARKRLVSNVYAKSSLHASPAVARIAEELMCRRLLPRLGRAGGRAVEAYEVFNAAAMDFVTAYIFGLGQGAGFLVDAEHCRDWLVDYNAKNRFNFWPQEMPGVYAVAGRLGLDGWLVPGWASAAHRKIEAWIMAMCERAETALAEGGMEDEEGDGAVYRQLRTAVQKQSDGEKQHDGLDEAQKLSIASELSDHTLAGFDTTGIVMTYLAWQLSKAEHRAVQDDLRTELRSCGATFTPGNAAGRTPDVKTLDALPMLHAVVMESLRLHASIPGGQPRVSPPDAVLGPPGAEVAGIPAGTRVNAQAWSLHLNEQVYPEATQWRPRRWLGGDGGISAGGDKAKWFWAFGSGGRMCVGSNLAMLDMKVMVAAVWAGFSTTIADDRGMVPCGGYECTPLGTAEGTRLLLRFEPVEQ